MLRSRAPWLALTLAALLAACAPQETADMAEEAAQAVEEMDMSTVVEAVDAMEAAYIAAYNAKDAAGIAGLFAADGRQSPPETPALDPAGVEAAYAEQFAADATFNLEVEREDLVASGDMVVSWGTFTATVTPMDGEAWTVSGRYGVVSREQADGTWKIYRHMFNYEMPPPDMGMGE